MKLFSKFFLIASVLFTNLHIFAAAPHNKVYISNENGNSISMYDTTTGDVKQVDIGGKSKELALTPDGLKLYILKEKSVYVLNTETLQKIADINLSKNNSFFSEPKFIAINGTSAYVTATSITKLSMNAVAAKLCVINTQTQEFEELTYSPLREPGQKIIAKGVAITFDGNHVYAVYNVLPNNTPNAGNFAVQFEIPSNKRLSTFQIHTNSLTTIPHHSKIYGSHEFDPHLMIINTINNFVSTSNIQRSAHRFAAQLSINIPIAYATARRPHPELGKGNIILINTNNNTFIKYFTVPGEAWGIALNNDGTKLYVTNYEENKNEVFILNVNATGDITGINGNIKTAGRPWGIVVGPESSEKKIVLPPSNLKGEVIKNRFLTQTDIVNHLTWKASPDQNVVIYNIYRNDRLIGNVSSNSRLEFVDHNRKERKLYTYAVEAVDSDELASNPVIYTIED
ncbi:MAG: hypothetical protein H0W88_05490 [Parachlamydiaceae bacterium]|nr:hypothetical protein [Parachlamydiaceae bacterium]